MSLILPPKRFQSCDDPKYDPIRIHSWFTSLIKRREKIPVLKQAYITWTCTPDFSQEKVAAMWGIDPREFQDYAAFSQGSSRTKKLYQPEDVATIQKIVDMAYGTYCVAMGTVAFSKCLAEESKLWGRKPRHIQELWEIDPTLYPTGYIKE